MKQPNYIIEINMFYDWLETNQIPKSSIALWHALMHIANKTRWEKVFTVAMSTIESKTGFKRSELFEARNRLEQKGRIKWNQRSGNLCAEYQIMFFCVHNTDTNTDTKAYANTDTNTDAKSTQSRTISKQDKTKQNQTKNSKSHSETEVPVIEKIEKLQMDQTRPQEDNFHKALVAVWFEVYQKQFSIKPSFGPVEGAKLKSIRKKLEDKCREFDQEWNVENASTAFKQFLMLALTDKWLKDNFQLSILDSKFDLIIVKGLKIPNGINQAATAEFFKQW